MVFRPLQVFRDCIVSRPFGPLRVFISPGPLGVFRVLKVFKVFRDRAVPALVLELRLALREAEARAGLHGGKEERSLPAQLLLQAGERQVGAAPLLGNTRRAEPEPPGTRARNQHASTGTEKLVKQAPPAHPRLLKSEINFNNNNNNCLYNNTIIETMSLKK